MTERIPDVTVVTAVYNTMPYVTKCLESLAVQTIGADRFEVLAVDDGSTDGSGAELDRFAAEQPEIFRVFHQENSGGPAAPSNLALEHARGRYVIFVGSDDYLGPESLERMVVSADEWGSDVLLCKMVGVGGRKAPPVFERTVPDAEYPSNDLAWALSNTKLFRRELIEREGLRFPEDMEVLSDGPFTLRAMAKARKVSILADYDHYYAVKRDKAENLTYATAPLGWADAAERLVSVTRELFDPGQGRDDLIYRVFSREIAKMLQPEFLELDPLERAKAWDAAADFADANLTEELRHRLPTEKRVRLSLAQRRDHTRLEAALAEPAPRFLLEDDRLYVRYPGFRDPDLGLPDSWYEATEERVVGRFARGTSTESIVLEDEGEPALEVACRVPLAGLDAATAAPARIGARKATKKGSAPKRSCEPVEDGEPFPGLVFASSAELAEDGRSTVVRARLPLASLCGDAEKARWSPRLYADFVGKRYDLPLDPGGHEFSAKVRVAGRSWRLATVADSRGRLVVRLDRIGLKRMAKSAMRRLGTKIGK